ncbi:MAG TPA: Uma2 family endonuclease [Allocoleopsis sp.]
MTSNLSQEEENYMSAIALKDDIKLTPDILSETAKKMTFEEYLLYVPSDDFKYELDQGELIQMTAATGLHTAICGFLEYEIQGFLVSQNLPLVGKSSVGVRTDIASSRIPDVIVCTESLWESLVNRKGAGVLNTGENPELVIEVVSENRATDYMKKRNEYATINIPEYWIVDSQKERVRLLTLEGDEAGYKERDFVKGENVVSLRFPGLVIPVDLILSPPVVENLRREKERQFLQVSQELDLEKQRAEKLAAKLREMGVNLDEI